MGNLHIHIALAGNPNCGKSTIFNTLTGSHQHVGNWPGKTVEKKEGTFSYNGSQILVVDLPGAYSLTAFSQEEVITRDYIIREKPDLVVAVIDATNLERNLYLAVQILELDVPMVIALNMTDLADKQGIHIDEEKLSKALHSRIVFTVAHEKQGIDDLIHAILDTSGQRLSNA
jgi:small GTP-binding protein